MISWTSMPIGLENHANCREDDQGQKAYVSCGPAYVAKGGGHLLELIIISRKMLSGVWAAVIIRRMCHFF
jgi:hypothetical protein